MSCWALIAVKRRTAGKSRLAGALRNEDRVRLVSHMLEHVLASARGCPGIDAIAVMSPESFTMPSDVLVLPDEGDDLNDSLHRAMRVLAQRHAERIVLLPADLPWVRSTELDALVHASRPGGLALAPDRHDQGTNALCIALPTGFAPQFGPGSLARHLGQAGALGLTPAILRQRGLAFDVDEPDDLAYWAAQERETLPSNLAHWSAQEHKAPPSDLAHRAAGGCEYA